MHLPHRDTLKGARDIPHLEGLYETLQQDGSPNRLQQIRIESQPETTQRPAPPRLQVLTDRPNLRTTFPRRPEPTTTERPTTQQRLETTKARFSTAGRPASPFAPAPTTAAPAAPAPVAEEGLPAPVKAAPGPNGEEYYYYYYYYDDEEGAKNVSVKA